MRFGRPRGGATTKTPERNASAFTFPARPSVSASLSARPTACADPPSSAASAFDETMNAPSCVVLCSWIIFSTSPTDKSGKHE